MGFQARVKATSKIVQVIGEGIQNSNMVMTAHGEWFTKDELDIVPLSWKPFEPTYWQKLEHQAAIAAMQGLVTRGEVLGSSVQEIARDIAEISCEVAHALVEKYKEKKE